MQPGSVAKRIRGPKGQKRTNIVKMAGLYWKEKLGEGQPPNPWAGEFRVEAGYASQDDRIKVGTEGYWENVAASICFDVLIGTKVSHLWGFETYKFHMHSMAQAYRCPPQYHTHINNNSYNLLIK